MREREGEIYEYTQREVMRVKQRKRERERVREIEREREREREERERERKDIYVRDPLLAVAEI